MVFRSDRVSKLSAVVIDENDHRQLSCPSGGAMPIRRKSSRRDRSQRCLPPPLRRAVMSEITLLVPRGTSEVSQPSWHVATSVGACARAGECAKCPIEQAPGITMTNVRDRQGAHAGEV